MTLMQKPGKLLSKILISREKFVHSALASVTTHGIGDLMQILSPFQLAENSKSFLGPVLTNQTKFSNKINPAQIEHNTMKWVCRYFAVGVMKMDYASPRTDL